MSNGVSLTLQEKVCSMALDFMGDVFGAVTALVWGLSGRGSCLCNDATIASRALGFIEGDIGFAEKFFPRRSAVVEKADAKAGRDVCLFVVDVERVFFKPAAKAFDGVECAFAAVVWHEQHKLFSAKAADGVRLTDKAAEQTSGFYQRAVAACVSVGIVEALEAINVECDDGEVKVRALCECERLFAGTFEATAVEHARQRIGERLMSQVRMQPRIHHPDIGEWKDGTGDDVHHAANDFKAGTGIARYAVGVERNADARELNSRISAQEGSHHLAWQPCLCGVPGGEQQPHTSSGLQSEREVEQGDTHDLRVGKIKLERKGASYKDEWNKVEARAVFAEKAQKRNEETAIAHGGDFQADAVAYPGWEVVMAEVDDGADDDDAVGVSHPAEAGVGAVAPCHAGKDDGQADKLDILYELNGVGQQGVFSPLLHFKGRNTLVSIKFGEIIIFCQ